MNKKAKNIAAAALAVSGVAIWIPQLLGAGGASEPRNTVEFPAEGALPQGSAFVAGWEPAAAGASAVTTSEETASAAGESSSAAAAAPVSSLDQLLDSKDTAKSLNDLSALWGAESRSANEDDSGSLELERGISAQSFADPLQVFLDENALTGIIVGKSARMASFGPYLLSEGEQVLGSEARVSTVAARYVVFEYHGDSVRVELPPFRVRAAPVNPNEDGQSEVMPGAGTPTASTTSNIPTGESSNE